MEGVISEGREGVVSEGGVVRGGSMWMLVLRRGV